METCVEETVATGNEPPEPPEAPDPAELNEFRQHESNVRSYCRTFPVIFERARGEFLHDRQGNEYIDFFSGAGSLNYGHNPPDQRRCLIEYLEADGIVHGLDMATGAKEAFIRKFRSSILEPKGCDYIFQFVSPSGTNGIEAALKLARKVKRRSNIVAFTNAYHGLSAGSLAATANSYYRAEEFINRQDVSFLPYDGYLGEESSTIDYIRRFISDPGSGVDLPAAVVVETIQCEGGVNVASRDWLRALEQICREHDILLIVDDIQVGCGRTGTFFSFEESGIRPDMVVLSKSISGYGLPMALVLMRRELDQWQPGEHSGTFRGNNLAFLTATEALRHWDDEELSRSVKLKGERMRDYLRGICEDFPESCKAVRGRGMITGLEMHPASLAAQVARECFRSGLVIETCGASGEVLKLLPPLTINDDALSAGLLRIRGSVEKLAG